MPGKRYESADTLETALHLLHKLQSEGLVLEDLEWKVKYSKASRKGPKIPTGAVVTIRLTPVFGRVTPRR